MRRNYQGEMRAAPDGAAPQNTALSLSAAIMTGTRPSSPPDMVQERGRGRGILLAAAPHPETCPLCRCKLVGKGHS